MVRSYAHTRNRQPRGRTALANAAAEAEALLRAYDTFVLGGYDAGRDRRLEAEGCGGWCRGTVRFALPAQPFLFQERGQEEFELARRRYGCRISGTLAILRRQGATPLSTTQTAEALRYWLRRCFAAVVTRLRERRHYRATGSGIARIGTFVDFLVIDVLEALVPWTIIREFVEPIVYEAYRRATDAEEQRDAVAVPV